VFPVLDYSFSFEAAAVARAKDFVPPKTWTARLTSDL
jgi:hypothetical protein